MIPNKKQEAIGLRRKGKSYNEISEELGISKSTLSDWFKNDEKSQKTKLMLSDPRNNPAVAERIKNFIQNKEMLRK